MVTPHRLLEIDRVRRRWAVAATVARCLVATAVIITIYYLLPLEDAHPDTSTLERLTVGGLVFVAVMAYELRRILRADLPQLRAAEAVFVALPLFLVAFASAYVSLAHADPASFSQHLGRTAGLYFVVVTLGTVGYGDITPVTDFARILVSAQIVVDLAFLALVLRVAVGAARMSLQRGRPDAAEGAGGAGPDVGPGADEGTGDGGNGGPGTR
ncbi:two pore domain potassium channel family protein [Streptacidiphilus sp. PB12-B1b]|uniref:potassium channel family protein n=1 Tax=Streptacidiphilus sp. PB12-B1b TaxID=2705012 RepID=UPI0015FC6114|nr:potassium channel family protein [Streptacidiphilus sp. PB12-B1b]QMU79864.1 two pore domain potassium channel family protein [Streptacidiphilus sp. PB12-B1b]